MKDEGLENERRVESEVECGREKRQKMRRERERKRDCRRSIHRNPASAGGGERRSRGQRHFAINLKARNEAKCIESF